MRGDCGACRRTVMTTRTLARLACHPATPAPWIDALRVEVTCNGEGALTLAYTLEGELDRLRLPPSCPACRRDGLWRHTCFEAFMTGTHAPGYREFNLAPSGAWQAYDFDGYRRHGRPASSPTPRIECRQDGHGLTLQATLPPQALPAAGPWRLGVCAVLEDSAGGLSYWALRHPPGRPDFHHPEGFALELDLPP